MIFSSKKLTLPDPKDALLGRNTLMPVTNKHFVTGNPIVPPFPEAMEQALFGMGCFWGAERKFWQYPGVFSTAVGYAGGYTPNPTYEELCTGLTGHNEVVKVIYDPAIVSYRELLRLFWESHNPTQGMRQGNDIGTQYRSGIYTYTQRQLDEALTSKHHYQHQLTQLGFKQITTEIMAAVVMLSATVKFKGSMILQVQGDGDIKTLVAQATDQRKIRGLVRGKENVAVGPLEAMFGHGQLVLTIESGNGHPYQGIVPLQGSNLAAVLQTYFEQSEQLKTRLWLFANASHAVGLLLQELPAQESYQADWEHIEILANTVTEQELFDLDCEQLLYRLFNQEKIRLFDAEPVEFSCACSRPNIERTLCAMGRTELEDILKERNSIEVNCEFCSEQYHFDKVDVENILSRKSTANHSETRH